jgi:hypothetical protein
MGELLRPAGLSAFASSSILSAMELRTFKAVMEALNAHEVRYLLAGGMAVVAHGYGRMTYDIDLVVQLAPDNIIPAFEALGELGFGPRVPVTAEQFADRETRESWIRDKGMTVLNFFSQEHRATTVDVFVQEPFDFDAAYEEALQADAEGIPFRCVDIDRLIAMKEEAARPVDLEDIRHLRMIADDEG